MSNPHYQIYPSRNWRGAKRWHWRYKAGNGEIIASGEAYHNARDCEHAVDLMRESYKFPVRWLECA